ncbi:hypothetical protein WICMUC_003976 [Wickerhamomyces mucosus]|uniref:CAP-Gly domain-containing protein n=1 Tax=Wickerhamomyces mucosus TaxID=1378264 RepID=A0A9P8PJE6_9ASCO|nr:hypothetical protein WICMUC_003976 [Wickerhamomyces mucosus]
MRRYSEIPNTPTPLTKSWNVPPSLNSDIKIGSILILKNTGKAILKFVGEVDGKKGRFAGIELLGESSRLGKNNGDVNGVFYFRTSTSDSGLFMTYDKLLNSIESIESPVSKRLSRISTNSTNGFSPSAVRHSMTPSLTPSVKSNNSNTNGNGNNNVYSGTKRKPSSSSLRGSNTNAPFSPVSQSSTSIPKSQLEKELQKLSSTKIIIENERDILARQSETLRGEINNLTNRLQENELLVEELKSKFSNSQSLLQNANDRARIAETKLSKQRALYEEQRSELLEVIDQVETQVNDNEALYITELKKLQEELDQKQSILKNMNSRQKDMEEQLKKHKNSLQDPNNEQVESLLSEVETLKLTNSTQSKAIVQLRDDLKKSDQRLIDINRETLSLKEYYLKETEESQEKNIKKNQIIENLNLQLEEKDNKIKELVEQIDSSVQTNESDLSEKIEEQNHENAKLLEELNKLKEASSDSNDLKILNKQIKNLNFELEMKDYSISELKETIKSLTENQQSKAIESNNIPDSTEKQNDDEILKLKKELHSIKENIKSQEKIEEELKEKDIQISELNKKLNQLTESNKYTDELNAYELQIKSKDGKISQLENDLKKLTIKLEDQSNSEVEEYQDQISALQGKISKLEEKLSEDTQAKDELQVLEYKLVSKDEIIEDLKKKIIQYDYTEANDSKGQELERLQDALKTKETDLNNLQGKVDNLEVENRKLSKLNISLAEKENIMDDLKLKIKKLEEEKFKVSSSIELNPKSILDKEELIAQQKDEIEMFKSSYERLTKSKDETEAARLELEKLLAASKESLEAFEIKDKEEKEVKSRDNTSKIIDEFATIKQNLESLLEEKTLDNELLREELDQLKFNSIDSQQDEVKELKTELTNLKKLNNSTTNSELNHQIHLLQKELESRPTAKEVKELRSELELIEDLRKVEARAREKEIFELNEKLAKAKLNFSNNTTSNKPLLGIDTFKRSSHSPLSTLSINRPQVISQVIDGELQIHIPEKTIDPANGRKLWCGLCEREGHDSIDCPFENDVF